MGVDRFIELWNSDKTVAEIAKVLGISNINVSSRASKLRMRGVKLVYKYPPADHYRRIGALGGKASKKGGFYFDRDLAARAGSVGGRISRRGKSRGY